ncbi:MAG: type II toxin-antitoxin system VapC family toxin [Nocardioides sp.]|uniref:type II toxin-antitoxin system VapC family toxin n=1 Tax=Nocardioides sp. TaxID=35761 RepID=UPI0039E278C0
MIAADTSALVAVVLGEVDAERYLASLSAEPTLISAVSLVEAGIVVEARQGVDATRDLDLLVSAAIDQVVPVDHDHATVAFNAWRQFGKGRHPAGLNLGDCFSYAVARLARVPLLFKGDDFSRTDIAVVP